MFSFDAGAFGARLGPSDAYRFAKGEEIMASSGQPVKLSRPLDFLVVADHSDNMGFFPELLAGNPDAPGRSDRPEVVRHDPDRPGRRGGGRDDHRLLAGHVSRRRSSSCPDTRAYRSAWDETIEAAEEANDPGRFTAFIGYEWTSNTGGNNLHRNVIFRDNGDKASQVVPYTTHDAARQRQSARSVEVDGGLRGRRPAATCSPSPHNGNLSNGRMFPMIESFTGKPIDREYAETRAKWERLYEATQIKGDGETHPFLSPNDEFANFERWDKGNLDLSDAQDAGDARVRVCARRRSKNGLKLEASSGVNPYKFGMIGSTDAHTGLAAVDEDNFFGKTTSIGAERPSRATHPFVKTDKATIMGWEQTASGYAAVWATENTRESIFDAMERRETYATTGPRMLVRFFGGCDFDARTTRTPAARPSPATPRACRWAATSAPAPAGKAPTFLVAALKDPIGANLDRYQIVKGWLDAEGEVHEQVYDVAWSGDRKPGADGKLPAVGNTVDVANATWTNTIGAPELIAVWTDPDFDPAQRAFYYGRVLEIPTPRWTAYDAKYFGIDDAGRGDDDDAGARLHLADLVHAGDISLRQPRGEAVVAARLPRAVTEGIFVRRN